MLFIGAFGETCFTVEKSFPYVYGQMPTCSKASHLHSLLSHNFGALYFVTYPQIIILAHTHVVFSKVSAQTWLSRTAGLTLYARTPRTHLRSTHKVL